MVYLIIRSQYQSPHGRQVVEFPDEDLVAWFKGIWITRKELLLHGCDDAFDAAFDPWECQEQIFEARAEEFGGGFYGLCDFLIPMLDRSPPQSMAEVAEFIASFGAEYSEGDIELVDSAIQAITNDDEIEIAWYLFDSAFAERFPARTAFLLPAEIELPEDSGETGCIPATPVNVIESADHATYCCFFSSQDGETISDMEGCYRLPVRLPQLSEWLATRTVGSRMTEHGGWTMDLPAPLILLRAFALATNNSSIEGPLQAFDEVNKQFRDWLPALLDRHRWKTKDPSFLVGDAAACKRDLQTLLQCSLKPGEKGRTIWKVTKGRTRFQFSPHLIQAVFSRFLTADDEPTGPQQCFYTQWILFDDLWANANHALAESILRYDRGYDLLSSRTTPLI